MGKQGGTRGKGAPPTNSVAVSTREPISEEGSRTQLCFLPGPLLGSMESGPALPLQERLLSQSHSGCFLVTSYFVKVHVLLTLPALSFLDYEC